MKKRQTPIGLTAPFDGYDEADDTEEKAKANFGLIQDNNLELLLFALLFTGMGTKQYEKNPYEIGNERF